MLNRTVLAATIVSSLLFSSCDSPTSDNDSGVATDYVIDTIKVDYKNDNNIVFYDFSKSKATVVKNDVWDIAFDKGLSIISNSGRYGDGVMVAATEETDFAKDYSAFEATWTITDTAEGGNVLGTSWYNPSDHGAKESIYLIKDETGAIYKMQVTDAAMQGGSSLSLKIAPAAGADITAKKFPFDTNYDLLYIDCGAFAEVDVAPMINDWDVKFHRNQEILSPTYTAGRSSIIINSVGGVTAGAVADMNADKVLDVSTLTFSDYFSAIGNSWYAFDTDSKTFSVPQITYVIKDGEGNHAKFQMTSFYGPISGQQFYSSMVYLLGDSSPTFSK